MDEVFDTWVNIGTVMTNFDNSCDTSLEQRLLHESVVADYAARNFHGIVVFNKTTQSFFCRIKQYRIVQEVIEAPTLREIMKRASEKYGWR